MDARQIITALFSGVMLLAVGGLAGWSLRMSERVATIEAGVKAQGDRLDGLEQGRTTPMAKDTRTRFEAIETTLDDLKDTLVELRDGQRKMLERMADER